MPTFTDPWWGSQPQPPLTRYRQAARERFDTGEGAVVVCESATVEIDSEREGAWVHAQLFVPIDVLDPNPGPTYAVWIAEQGRGSLAPGGYIPGPWTWTWDQDFTCDDDPGGYEARRSAHEYARHLRSTYPCAFVAVRPAGAVPLPVMHS